MFFNDFPQIYDMLKTYIECVKKGQLNGGIYNEEWHTRRGRPSRGQEQYMNGKPDKKTVVVAKKKTVVKPRTPKPVEPVVLPFPPSNGKYYLRSEFFKIACALPKGKRKNTISYLLESKLVPVAKTTLYSYLSQYEDDPDNYDVGDDEWKKSNGRPDAFTDQEISEVAGFIHANPRHYDSNDIEQLLLNTLRNRLINRGKDPSEAPDKMSKTTRRNYMTLIASKLEKLKENSTEEGKKKKEEVFKYIDGKLYIVSGPRNDDD